MTHDSGDWLTLKITPNFGRFGGAARIFACILLLITVTSGSAVFGQGLDLSNWTVEQAGSASAFTIPGGTVIQPGGYLVLGRFADQASFESFWGVSLSANVV